MKKNRLIYGSVLAGLAVLYLMTNAYGALTLLLAAVALSVISLLFLYLPSKGIEIFFEMPEVLEKEPGKEGEEGEAVLWAVNRNIRPFIDFECKAMFENRLTLGRFCRTYRFALNGKSKKGYAFLLGGYQAGTIAVHIQEAVLYDSLHIASKRIAVQPRQKGKGSDHADAMNQETRVVPAIIGDTEFLEQPMVAVEESEHYAQDRPGTDVSEVFALRDYRPGDSLRSIHWKLSGKTDDIMVREFSLPVNASLVILIELSQDTEMEVGKCLETALSMSKSFAETGIAHILAWYDSEEGRLCTKEIFSPEDYEGAFQLFLGAHGYREPELALFSYREQGYLSRNKLLMYVTLRAASALYEEIALQQPMKMVEPLM